MGDVCEVQFHNNSASTVFRRGGGGTVPPSYHPGLKSGPNGSAGISPAGEGGTTKPPTPASRCASQIVIQHCKVQILPIFREFKEIWTKGAWFCI